MLIANARRRNLNRLAKARIEAFQRAGDELSRRKLQKPLWVWSVADRHLALRSGV